MTTLPKHLAGLNSAFGKDMSQEALLADVNALIAPVQRQLEQRAPASPLRPVVLVLGPPRSGTTLVSQLITTSRLFGTVCNLAARFWEAPAFGLVVRRRHLEANVVQPLAFCKLHIRSARDKDDLLGNAVGPRSDAQELRGYVRRRDQLQSERVTVKAE